MARPPKDPLVVVIGATAIELATQFNGEIINGDAMQMYKGLPIITNKIPEHERNGVPHHLLDTVRLEEQPWTVNHFVKESSRIIHDIRTRGKLPIVVGGTHYYTHALLFKDATLTDEAGESTTDGEQVDGMEDDFPILSRPTEEILQALQEVDPDMARRWHPKDRRKIQRSLQIWLKTGRKASEVYAEQQERRPASRPTDDDADSSRLGGELGETNDEAALRYPTLLLWLEAEDAVLKVRLNDRVDAMVKAGLIDEALALTGFEEELIRQGVPMDKTKGIWVSIGYKEMETWLKEGQTTEPNFPQASRALTEAVESVKAGTRRYAKRQNRYIRIRLANALQRADEFGMLFLLDCSNLDKWDTEVAAQAQRLVRSFLVGEELPDHKSLSELAAKMLSADEQPPGTNRVARTCDTCDKTLMTDKEWHGHLASRGHKKAVAAQRKREARPNQEPVYPHTASSTTAQD
ncbi:tRNA dimethylallyltransferase, mitochondrial [Exophiala xenobiotica]|nr:tRNA dimethylallyltransferase, mitochondrial [Exophiala xenobiotica]